MSSPATGPHKNGDKKAFMTEGPEGADKHVQFFDTPKARLPQKEKQHADRYVAPASSASQTTTKLLQKRRKNTEWQQALELKREEFAKRMAECDARQTQLKKKCKELRKRVQTKEQEVQETRTKIERATKKQEEERLFQSLKDKEIVEKKDDVQMQEREHEDLKQKLDTRNQYKAYLDRVCEEHEGTGLGFDEVDSILMKYDSFQWTQKNLNDMRNDHAQQIEELRDNLAKYSKISVTKVVEKNARISEMRSLLDDLRNQTRDQTSEDEKRKWIEQKRIKELGNIEMAVDNLYNRVLKHGKPTKAAIQEAERLRQLPGDEKLLAMLDRLCVFLIDMKEISKEAKNHPKPPEQSEVVTRRPAARKTDANPTQAQTQQQAQDRSSGSQRRGSISQAARRNSIADKSNSQILSSAGDQFA